MFSCKKKIWLFFLFKIMLCFPLSSFSKLYFVQDIITEEIKNDLDIFTFDFVLKNDSQNIIRILEVRPSCSCMNIRLSAQEIAPKKSLNLSGNISIRKLSGRNVFSLEVITDDNRSILAKIDIKVIPIVTLTPSIVIWKADTKPVERTISVMFNNTDYELNKIESYSNKFDINIDRMRLHVTIRPVSMKYKIKEKLKFIVSSKSTKKSRVYYAYLIIR